MRTILMSETFKISLKIYETGGVFIVEQHDHTHPITIDQLYKTFHRKRAQDYCSEMMSRINLDLFKISSYSADTITYEPRDGVEWFKISG